jgi:hypothetical protein
MWINVENIDCPPRDKKVIKWTIKCGMLNSECGGDEIHQGG